MEIANPYPFETEEKPLDVISILTHKTSNVGEFMTDIVLWTLTCLPCLLCQSHAIKDQGKEGNGEEAWYDDDYDYEVAYY